jgi:peptide/nickel transport system substrate-binding protein
MSAQGSGRDSDDNLDPRISRKRFLQGAAGVSLALGAGGLLSACGGDDDDGDGAATTAAASAEVKRGGVFKVGHVGGGKNEGFNPGVGGGWIDTSRQYQIYDPLTRVNPDLTQAPGLALEWNPNDDSTVYEVKLRPDVVFHNGKSFTADDVIYSLRLMGDEKHTGHFAVANINLNDVKKVDDLTVEIPLKSPNADLAGSFVNGTTVMVQDGHTDFTKPIGTGPFVLESFTAGERSHATANKDYWEEGKPYVDAWEDISIDDADARLNALLSGEIDAMSQLGYPQAKAHLATGDINVVNAPSPSMLCFYMAVDIAPFDNPKVREAFRYIPDRQALIDGAISGFGTVANDLFGKGYKYFAEDLPAREADPEKAMSLLKEAGHENLEVTLHTSDAVPGFVESATLFAQQAKAAGVTVNIKKESASAFFDTSLLYTKLDFSQDFWAAGSLGAWYELALLSTAAWNETHWKQASYDALIREAQGAKTEEEAEEKFRELQQIQYDEGGYIIWTNINIVDATANYVKGIEPSSFTALGGWNYRSAWLDK